MTRRLLVVGASGVIGASVVEKFALEGWDVLAASRRRPLLPQAIKFEHVAIDLANAAQCAEAIADAGPITHMVYAAVAEAPGLLSGWSDAALIATNRQMFLNIADHVAQSGHLRWIGLLQGTKAYGAHLHPIELPAREDRQRDPHPNFYWEQEDHLRELGRRHGFGWTILRPQIVLGGAAGAAMNPVLAIGAYAAICRELNLPFAYPADRALIWETTDASLLAAGLFWAAHAEAAANHIYNITNGDIFVLADAWSHIAHALGLETAAPERLKLADFFARTSSVEAWDRLVARYDLQPLSLAAFLGQSHHYFDLLLDSRVVEAGGLPALVSGLKIRKAGFPDCCDSLDSLLFWIRRMSETRLLPGDMLASEPVKAGLD